MARVFRPTYSVPVPADAMIVQRPHTHKRKRLDAWPFVELTEDGRKVYYPLTADGKAYLKESECWYAEYRDAEGKRTRTKGYTDKAATLQLAARLEREAFRMANGLGDAYAVHKKRPLTEHLEDYRTALKAKDNSAKHVRLTAARIRIVLEGCKFKTFADLSASKFSQWLAGQRDNGLGVQTSNYYQQSTKGFLSWMVRDGRLSENPFVHLQQLNAKTDIRRERRDLQPEEVARLIKAAYVGKKFRGLTGPDRAALYLTALGTGFRSAELASLTPEAFNLDGTTATITLEAAYSKHRREDVQPIRRDLAEVLRPWLATKQPKRLAWPGSWSDKSAKMIRKDLDSARREWIDEAKENADEMRRRKASGFLTYDNEDGTADFHALRHTFITGLAKNGVHPKTAQALARHSTITLTMDRYSHVDLENATNALEGLPSLSSPCPALVQSGFSATQFPAIVCSKVENESETGNVLEVLDLQGFAGHYNTMQRIAPTRFERVTGGLEIYPLILCNSLSSKALAETGECALVPPLSNSTESAPLPSDLQTLADTWPTLDETTRKALLLLASPSLNDHIRRGVLALLDAKL